MYANMQKKWHKLSKKQLLLFLQLLFLIATKMCQISMITNYKPNICFKKHILVFKCQQSSKELCCCAQTVSATNTPQLNECWKWTCLNVTEKCVLQTMQCCLIRIKFILCIEVSFQNTCFVIFWVLSCLDKAVYLRTNIM